VVRGDLGPGWRFQLALETLQGLHRARSGPAKGRTVTELAAAAQVSHLGIEAALEPLLKLDWVARIDPAAGQTEPRYVLLADPDSTPLAPLLQDLLLRREASTEGLWSGSQWARLRLRDVL
jgi:membrane protein